MSSKKEGLLVLFFFLGIGSVSAALLDSNDIGFSGQTFDQNYETLINSLYSNGAVATSFNGKLWVPWFSSSSECQINNLHSGNNCNSGQPIDFNHNCMVSDELSQLGILIAMSKNQTRMNEYYGTLIAIRSNKGQLPSWRSYRNGNSIEACRPGINGNCDTASDADARIITSLFIASKNPYFSNSFQKTIYEQSAVALVRDFLNYDVLYDCKPSSLGQGNICYWLTAGAGAKNGGMSSNDFAYTGYYSDAIIAMLSACSITGNTTYCDIADDFTLNYLQASNYNGNSFSVPPGRSFKWANSGGVPRAECTSSCNPAVWDYADAPRAVGICQANYYAVQINHPLPLLQQYCNQWGQQHMSNVNSAPIQYYTNGQALNSQSSYFAQGLQALYQSGGYNNNLFRPTVINALGHYTPQTRTWDWGQCFGVYMQSFAVRSLGFGIGRDEGAFRSVNNARQDSIIRMPAQSTTIVSGGSNGNISAYNISCSYNNQNCSRLSDVTSGDCRTILFGTSSGNIQMLACKRPNSTVEVYRQSYPSGTFRACLHTACIDELRGFASFNI